MYEKMGESILTYKDQFNEIHKNLSVGTRLFNNPRMTLDSYVKGPSNMICREVGLKGRTLVTGQRFSRGFYGSLYMGGLGLTS